MRTAMSRIFAPLRREASFLSQKGHSALRFKLDLTISLLLVVCFVFGGFELAGATQRKVAPELFALSGAVALSESELVALVKEKGLIAYWAGSKSGSKYTLIATRPGEVIVSYFAKNSDIGISNQAGLIVKTNVPLATQKTQAYSDDAIGGKNFLLSSDTEQDAIEYNSSTPTKIVKNFKDTSADVTIIDSTPGTALTYALTVGAIRRIS